MCVSMIGHSWKRWCRYAFPVLPESYPATADSEEVRLERRTEWYVSTSRILVAVSYKESLASVRADVSLFLLVQRDIRDSATGSNWQVLC